MHLPEILSNRLNFNIASFSLSPSYLEAGIVVFLVFILLLAVAQFRRHLLNWSFKGAFFGLFWGFVLALVVEGFLVLSGRTAVTEILGWKNAPKPILNVLDLGRAKLADVLGVSVTVPDSFASEGVNLQTVIDNFQSLKPTEAEKVKNIICNP